MAAGDTRFCDKCKKTINEKEFYGSNNLEKYPDGKLNTCKKCLTMHVDNWDPLILTYGFYRSVMYLMFQKNGKNCLRNMVKIEVKSQE